MGRKISNVVFELDRIYNSYAEQLLVSNAIAGMLHSSVDIKASGNQVEGSIRNLLSDLLPRKVSVSHGHILDDNMAQSRQQDIVIVEGLDSKSIIKTLDGTEFFMFESVYAVGEVKRTLSLKTFSEATESIKDTKNRLQRKSILPNVFSTNPNLITTAKNLTDYPIRNPLFSFVFSVDLDPKARMDDFKAVFSDRENWSCLPNLIVVLNKGIFCLIDKSNSSLDHISLKLYPEFEIENENCEWFFLPLSDEKKGRNLVYLISMIQQHIQDSLLLNPSLLKYASELMEINIRDLTNMNNN